MEIGAATDVGRKRTVNEDTLLVTSRPELPHRGTLSAVADGMGGHAAGEVASLLAVETLARRYFAGTEEPRAALEAAVQAANAAIWEAGRADPKLRGMGTTLVCAAVVGEQATIANVGDSQAYLIADGAIRQITVDHSWVVEQIARGRLSPAEAERHPLRHVLTRSLGVEPDVAVDLYEVPLSPGAALLLCSDGLSTHVRPGEMCEVVEAAPAREAAQRLVDLANERGGADNITVIVVRAAG